MLDGAPDPPLAEFPVDGAAALGSCCVCDVALVWAGGGLAACLLAHPPTSTGNVPRRSASARTDARRALDGQRVRSVVGVNMVLQVSFGSREGGGACYSRGIASSDTIQQRGWDAGRRVPASAGD
jgi:hypothetical protein